MYFQPDRTLRKQLFGPNLIHIPVPHPITLLLDEVMNCLIITYFLFFKSNVSLFSKMLHPFYLFQVFSVILWYYNDYGIYATAIVIMSTISCVTSVYQTRKNISNLREMAKYICPVTIITDGKRNCLPSLSSFN